MKKVIEIDTAIRDGGTFIVTGENPEGVLEVLRTFANAESGGEELKLVHDGETVIKLIHTTDKRLLVVVDTA